MQSSTADTFFDGKVVLHQPESGYRFSIDAVLLAHLACEQPGHSVLDLGTGCGVIPILLAYRSPKRPLVGVEIQPELSALARKNVAANRMDDRVRILGKDMRRIGFEEIAGPVDLVVSNPPYRILGSGRISSHSQRAMARHEISVDLETVLSTARLLLKKSGRLCLIYPASRAVDLLATLRAAGIEPKSLTVVHTNASCPGRLVAVTGVKGGRPGMNIGPPLFIYRDDGAYTSAVAAMFSKEAYSSNVFITRPDLTLG